MHPPKTRFTNDCFDILFPPSETSHLHTNSSMQKETLLQHVFYDYNTFYHFRSTIWQNKRGIDALPFSKTMQIAVILSLEDNYIFVITPFSCRNVRNNYAFRTFSVLNFSTKESMQIVSVCMLFMRLLIPFHIIFKNTNKLRFVIWITSFRDFHFH